MENNDTQLIEAELDSMENMSEPSFERTKKGFAMTGFGAALLLAGCISTMIVPSSHEMYDAILYIPTIIGASMVMYGFYCIFEK